MKPRLVKIKLLWYCLSKGCLGGLGYTPADAYREWTARNNIKYLSQAMQSETGAS